LKSFINLFDTDSCFMLKVIEKIFQAGELIPECPYFRNR